MDDDSFTRSNGGGANGATQSVLSMLESSFLGMWHLMTEASVGFAPLISLAFILFDALTTLSLAVSSDSLLAPFLRITVGDMMPAHDTTAFVAVYGIVQAIVWGALLNGAFVAWSFAIGRFRALWPALVLRAVIGVIGTALYNPTLEVLVIPLRCNVLDYYWGDGSSSPSSSNHARLLSANAAAGSSEGIICSGADPTLAAAQIILIVLSLLALLLFIPFALSTQLVYVESNSASEAWDAMSSGRDNVLDSTVRTALVLVTFFAKDVNPVAHAAFFLVALSGLAAKHIHSLPFYRPWYNMMRAGLYGISVWISLESLVLSSLRGGGADDATIHTAALSFVILVIPFSLLFSALPLLQYRRLRFGLAEVLLAVEEAEVKAARAAEEAAAEEEAAANAAMGRTAGEANFRRVLSKALSFVSHGSAMVSGPVKAVQEQAKSRATVRPAPTVVVKGVPPAAAAVAEAGGATAGNAAAAAGTAAASRTAVSPGMSLSTAVDVLHGRVRPTADLPKAGAHLTSNRGASHDAELICVTGFRSLETAEAARRFHGNHEAVEQMALLTLKTNWNPANVPAWQHDLNLASGLYTRKSIAIAERVFEHGLLAFPKEPGVRVAYARFLSTYAQDSARAIGMLQSVVKCNPKLEDRFALFSFGRSLDQQRASNDLGEGELDAVGIIAFRQTQSQALRHHSQAVAQILALWKMIEVRLSGGAGTGAISSGDDGTSSSRNGGGGGIAGGVGNGGGGGGGVSGGGGFSAAGGGASGVAGTNTGAVTATSITEQIAKIVESRRRAQLDYDKLIARYPNALLLLRSYMAFVGDVLNERQWATAIGARIDSILASEKADAEPNLDGDRKSAYQSSMPGGNNGSGSGRSGGRGADGAASQANSNGSWGRKGASMSAFSMQNSGTRSVAAMRWKMQAGFVALAILASVIFAVTRITLSDFSLLIDVLYKAGRRRYMVVAAGFYSRSLVLSSGPLSQDPTLTVMCGPTISCKEVFDGARVSLLEVARELQTTNTFLYDPTDTSVKMFEQVRDIYDYPYGYRTNQVDIGPPPVNITVWYGLQALLVKYAGNSFACAQMPVARLAKCCQNYCDDPVVWRFIQESWYLALTGADHAVEAYVNRAFFIMEDFGGIAFGLLAVVGCLVFALWTCVFWPAALSVQRSNAGVLAIAEAIPREAVRALIKRYTRLVQQLDELSEQVSGDAGDGEDGESDRGMDSEDEDGDVDSTTGAGGRGGKGEGDDVSEVSSTGTARSAHKLEEEEHDSRLLIVGSTGEGVNASMLADATPRQTPSQQLRSAGGRSARGGESERRNYHQLPHSSRRELEGASAGTALFSVPESSQEGASGASREEGGNPHPSIRTPALSHSRSHRTGQSGARFNRSVSFREDGSSSGNNTNNNNNTNSGSGSNSSTRGTMAADGELASLRRAGASAANVLDQMQAENNAFAFSIAAATGGVGNNTAARSFRLAVAAQAWEDAGNTVGVDGEETPGAGGGTVAGPPLPRPSPSSVNAERSQEETANNPLVEHGAAIVAIAGGGNDGGVDEGDADNTPSMLSPTTRTSSSASSVAGAAATTTGTALSPPPRSSLRSTDARQLTVRSTASKPRAAPGTPGSGPSALSMDALNRSTRAFSDGSHSIKHITLSSSQMSQSSQKTPVLSPSSDISGSIGLPFPPRTTLESIGDNAQILFSFVGSWFSQTISSFAVVLGFGGSMKLSPLLRSLSTRVALALVTLIGLQSIAAGLSYMQVNNAAYTASAINVAGYRRELAITAVFQARELLVGPDIIGTYELAVDTMRDYTDGLARYHSALLLGDEGMRLHATRGLDPLQDALLDEAPADAYSLVDLSNTTEAELLRLNSAAQGLDYLVMRYVDECNGFLARFEPSLSSLDRADRVLARYGSNLTENWEALTLSPAKDRVIGVDYSKSHRHRLDLINADEGFAQLQEMAFNLLDKKLERSVELYLEHTRAEEGQSTVVQVIVYVLNIAIVGLLQWGVFQRQFANLAAEAQRTQELLRLIPSPVLESMPRSVRAFLGNAQSSSGK